MASFIFIIAGLNLVLGYLLALYLAPEYQLPQLSPAAAPSAGGPVIAERQVVEAPVAAPAATPAIAVLAVPEPAAPVPAAEAAAPRTDAAIAAATAGANPASLSAAVAALVEQPPADRPVVQKTELVGALVEEFKDDLRRYRDQLASLDRRMRAEPEMEDPTAMQACLADLCAANARYLTQKEDSGDRLHRGCEAVEEHKTIGRQLGAALDQQFGEVREANEKLAGLNPQEDNLLGRERMFHETARLLDASDSLRDTLDDVEQQLSKRNRTVRSAAGEELAKGLVSRERLEATLADRWRADPDRRQPLSLGLIDMDRCRELNEGRGVQATDRVLASIAQLVTSSLESGQLATQLSGGKLLVLLTGCNGHASTAALERIRQQVETTRYQAGSDQFGANVSCAVAEALAADTITSILVRLETTLQEAKRYGRNRTFFHDGKFPTPVVPPTLSLEPRTQEV